MTNRQAQRGLSIAAMALSLLAIVFKSWPVIILALLLGVAGALWPINDDQIG